MTARTYPFAAFAAKDEVVSSAAVCPWTRTVAVGFESGGLLVWPREWKALKTGWDSSLRGVRNRCVVEPVNGVAYVGEYATVSTRSEFCVLRRVSGRSDGLAAPIAQLDFGSHGVIPVGDKGYFLAPLGMDGYVQVQPSPNKVQTLRRTMDEPINFYKIAHIRAHGGSDLFLAACREHGVAAFTIDEGASSEELAGLSSPDADIVSVAALGDRRAPAAAVALDADGSVLYIPDAGATETTQTLLWRSPALADVAAYTIMVQRGHGLILTSDALVVLPNMADNLLGGDPTRAAQSAFSIGVEASEMLAAGEGEFFLIRNSAAELYRVRGLFGEQPRRSPSVRPRRSIPYAELGRLKAPVSQFGFEPTSTEWRRSPRATMRGELVG